MKIDEEKLCQAYYEPDRLWTGGTSMPKKVIKSWLTKQALWQVHIPPPRELNLPHYHVTKPNEQHRFHLLYMPHHLY